MERRGVWPKFKQWLKKEFFVSTSASGLDLGIATLAGIKVTEEAALTFSAVFGAVKVLAESVAALPLLMYRRLDRGKGLARDHALFPLLHDLPNPELTSCEFREIQMAALVLWGNAYAEIQRNALGEILALWPIHPSRVQIRRPAVDAPLEYHITLPMGAGRVVLPKSQMLHVRALAMDGVQGVSPIRLHRETVALGLAASEFGARFFGQGMMAGGVLQHPGTLSDPAYDRLDKSIAEKRSGLPHSHRLLILEEGLKYEKLTIPPDDAQWLQTRKFQVNEIARIYRIPPHKLGDLEHATFSNIEEQSIEFVTDTLTPWLVRWEQAIARDLMDPQERKEFFVRFKLEGLLRGKTLERYQAHAVARQWGFESVNDILEVEDRNAIGPEGDIYLSPLNMISAEQALRMVQDNPDMEMEQDEGLDAEGRPRRRLTVRRRADALSLVAGNGDGGRR
jgi:HK97 family phage portal protein